MVLKELVLQTMVQKEVMAQQVNLEVEEVVQLTMQELLEQVLMGHVFLVAQVVAQ